MTRENGGCWLQLRRGEVPLLPLQLQFAYPLRWIAGNPTDLVYRHTRSSARPGQPLDVIAVPRSRVERRSRLVALIDEYNRAAREGDHTMQRLIQAPLRSGSGCHG